VGSWGSLKFIEKRFFKKSFKLCVTMIFLLALSSCNKATNKILVNNNGTIINSNLTAREQQLMRGTGAEKTFVFDVNLKNIDTNWIECWVDYYEKGEFKNKITGVGTTLKLGEENDGVIMLSLQDIVADEGTRKWIISYNSKSASGSGSTTTKKLKNKISSVSMSNEKNKIEVNKDINLAVIQEGANVTGSSQEVFNDLNTYIKESTKEDNVYVLKCKFINK
jgi:hypothetical protein